MGRSNLHDTLLKSKALKGKDSTATNYTSLSVDTPFMTSSHGPESGWVNIEAEIPHILAELENLVYGGDEDDTDTMLAGVETHAKITEFLKKTRLYSSTAERWGKIPEVVDLENLLYEHIENIIARVIKHFKIKNREVIDTHCTRLVHVGIAGASVRIKTSPDLMVNATSGEIYDWAGAVKGTYKPCASIVEIKTQRNRNLVPDFVQVAIYARQCFLQQQNRRFVYCLIITEKYADLYQFDRSGTIHTRRVNIHEDAVTFVRMILLVTSQDDEKIGFDTSIYYDDKGIRHIRTLDETSNEVTYKLAEPEPFFSRRAIQGRGTMCWLAEKPDGSRILIKDAWRSKDREAEFKMLDLVKGLAGVGQMIACEERGLHVSQLGLRLIDLEKLTACIYFRDRTFYRLTLEAYGDTIDKFQSRQQFLYAFRDAVAGHQRLWDASILHRDVSKNNVLLGREGAEEGNRGILIDLDMAIHLGRTKGLKGADFRTGTLAFQSIAVLQSIHVENPPPHDYLDDLESFFYIYVWITFGYIAHDQPITPRPEFLSNWENEKNSLASSTKIAFLTGLQYTDPVEEYFGKPFQNLMDSMKKFIGKAIRKKSKRKTIWDLKELTPLAEEHYKKFLSLIDHAIKEMEVEDKAGAAPVVEPPRTPTRVVAGNITGNLNIPCFSTPPRKIHGSPAQNPSRRLAPNTLPSLNPAVLGSPRVVYKSPPHATPHSTSSLKRKASRQEIPFESPGSKAQRTELKVFPRSPHTTIASESESSFSDSES